MRTFCILLLLLCTLATVPAMGLDFASSTVSSTKPLLGLGLAACFFGAKDKGPEVATHAGEAVMISVGVAETLKHGVGIGGDHAFPSAHTAAAFAMATSLTKVYPKKRWLLYTGAALIGWSTIKTGGHSVGDVIGGAALGIAVGNYSMSHNGVILGKTFKF
jgi:membrane-associated phospholipid phosphatase